MLNATPLKPAAINVNNASLNFGATIAQSKTNIFAAKPAKDEFVSTAKKEEPKKTFLDKLKNIFTPAKNTETKQAKKA